VAKSKYRFSGRDGSLLNVGAFAFIILLRESESKVPEDIQKEATALADRRYSAV
jgi:hypothetical protein